MEAEQLSKYRLEKQVKKIKAYKANNEDLYRFSWKVFEALAPKVRGGRKLARGLMSRRRFHFPRPKDFHIND